MDNGFSFNENDASEVAAATKSITGSKEGDVAFLIALLDEGIDDIAAGNDVILSLSRVGAEQDDTILFGNVRHMHQTIDSDIAKVKERIDRLRLAVGCAPADEAAEAAPSLFATTYRAFHESDVMWRRACEEEWPVETQERLAGNRRLLLTNLLATVPANPTEVALKLAVVVEEHRHGRPSIADNLFYDNIAIEAAVVLGVTS